MRLLLVSSEFPPAPGGIGTHAYQLAKHLEEAGADVTVVARQDYAKEEEIAAFNAVQSFAVMRMRSLPTAPVKALDRLLFLATQMRRVRADIVLASGMRVSWMTALLAARYHLPWVAVGHGTEFAFAQHWARALSRLAYSRASVVVCVSHFTQAQMGALGVRTVRSVVIHNGADARQFQPLEPRVVEAFRRGRGWHNSRLILTVGRVSERKGQDVVIRALPSILREYPDTHYLIAGLPDNKAAFLTLACQLGVDEHVHFLGRVTEEEVVLLQNCCDLFVMTSKRTASGDLEGYGIAVVEAALCGKAAVVSADSGLVEAIEPGRTGLAVPQNDEAATAEAILTLLRDDALRQRMGQAARSRALHSQTWAHCAAQYDALLKELVEDKGAR